MIVKIGDMRFNSAIEAIMIFFTSEEKKLISEMDESTTIFGSFPGVSDMKNANTIMATFKAEISEKKDIFSKVEQMTKSLFDLYFLKGYNYTIQKYYHLGLYDGLITQQEYEIAESIYGLMWLFNAEEAISNARNKGS